jgi:phytoene dehydrogenase-like protein
MGRLVVAVQPPVTQPGFLHDLGSSTYPLGAASPFYGSLPFTIPWIQPHAAFAHSLDDGTAVVLEHSIEETIDQLDAFDRKAYRSLIEPVVSNFAALVEEILGPFLHIPGSPFVLARFGLSALLPALSLARSHFAGVSTHSILPLETTASAAVGLTLIAAGHSRVLCTAARLGIGDALEDEVRRILTCVWDLTDSQAMAR